MPDLIQKQEVRILRSLLRACGWQRQEADEVFNMTNCRTAKIEEMTAQEGYLLKSFLTAKAKERRQPMRNKIIHYMCLLGYTKAGTTNPDFERINEKIKTIGSRNKRKVILNYLYYHELEQVLTQVESWYKSTIKTE